ncbi:hypothetical protein BKE38_15465 [Pseudoroseomonas deserti]|uniref:Uncharacterized protein n=1 Tax=Teichococcus deserti TaxID=1817963 RepID=A0A1V2H0B2_9PROT|nr:hypothetical protein [Pseudoroseomonas deserti]ONG51766.1 hypothetical protein BKE38_15465 [Pseudoroseomonas deserti]
MADHDAAAQAAALAEEFAPDLGAILFTIYPDADSLDTLRPGQTDPDSVNAANRAAAAVLAREGVQVFAQRADRGAFRRYMDGREDSQANRLAWRDRDRLLQGDAALQALGLDPKQARPRPSAAKITGSPADRLVRAFGDGGGPEFDDLAEELLAAGRDGVLDVARRKVAERFGDEAAEDFAASLLTLAEGAELGPSGWASLVALPVALQPGPLPDAAAIGASMIAAGLLEEALDIRFLPEWRAPERLAALSPVALRRVLLDMLEGRAPKDMPPAASLQGQDFALLLGLQIDWEIPVWEEVALNGLPEAPDEPPEGEEPELTPEQHARMQLFDRWRAGVFESSGGCVPLGLVAASETGAEIADFLAEAGSRSEGIEEIRNFVAVARDEARGEKVVCVPQVEGEALRLALYTESGSFLDELRLEADQLPVAAAEMPPLLAAFVTLVEAPPGG